MSYRKVSLGLLKSTSFSSALLTSILWAQKQTRHNIQGAILFNLLYVWQWVRIYSRINFPRADRSFQEEFFQGDQYSSNFDPPGTMFLPAQFFHDRALLSSSEESSAIQQKNEKFCKDPTDVLTARLSWWTFRPLHAWIPPLPALNNNHCIYLSGHTPEVRECCKQLL